MHRPASSLIFRLLSAGLVLSGCAHVSLRAGDLMIADRGPQSAHLPAGYRVEDGRIARDGGLIGFTLARHSDNRVLVLYCGGNNFHRSRDGASVLEALATEADVILFDYPGLGDSGGPFEPSSLLDTAKAVYEYAIGLSAPPQQKLLLYGFSLGGFVAAQLAGSHPVDALVLEATARNVEAWIDSQVPWYARPLLRVDIDPELSVFDNAKALTGFQEPVLVLAGSADRQTPVRLARDLARRLRAQGVDVVTHEIQGTDHGGIHGTPQFAALWQEFVDRVERAP